MNNHYRAKQWNCIEFLLNDYSNDITSFTICFKYCKTVLNRGQQKASIFKSRNVAFLVLYVQHFFFFFFLQHHICK